MRVPCPMCGLRDHGEFVYRGDAGLVRPDPDQPGPAAAFHAFVHLRANPAGWHKEHWYHEGGCRSWIVVERNTITHEIRGAVTASAHSIALRAVLAKPGEEPSGDTESAG